MRSRFLLSSAVVATLLGIANIPANGAQVGQILVCYACQNTGNAAVDAALAATPGVASDAILFAFVNSSSSPITGGVFSVTNASPNDSFSLPTIAANSTFILIPGVTSDGATHPSGGLFAPTGIMDTSDGAGGLSDSSIFRFTGVDNGLAVTSTTAGTSTAIPGTFTPGDPGLFRTFRDTGATGQTSFIGLGPNGDTGCINCYFGVVATLNTPGVSGVPEPATSALFIVGLGVIGWVGRRAFARYRD